MKILSHPLLLSQTALESGIEMLKGLFQMDTKLSLVKSVGRR